MGDRRRLILGLSGLGLLGGTKAVFLNIAFYQTAWGTPGTGA